MLPTGGGCPPRPRAARTCCIIVRGEEAVPVWAFGSVMLMLFGATVGVWIAYTFLKKQKGRT